MPEGTVASPRHDIGAIDDADQALQSSIVWEPEALAYPRKAAELFSAKAHK